MSNLSSHCKKNFILSSVRQLFQELPDLKVDKRQKRPDCELYKSPYFLKRSQYDWFWHYVLKIFEIPSLETFFIMIYTTFYH